tara:strand:- start:254 stop:1453 length:1200 start_codon:yes stop_codon:yes gene_type:complete
MKKKWIIMTALLIAIAAGGGYAVWHYYFAASGKPAVLTVPVYRGNIEETVVATGALEPKEIVSVGAQVSGRIDTLFVELGQHVRAGDMIAQIDARTRTNDLLTAEASLANVKAQLAARQASLIQAEQSFKRQQQMIAGQATSAAEFESAKASLEAARADVRALEAQIKAAEVAKATAEVNLGYTRVQAPINGVVVAIVTKQGQTVNAVQSAPTIVIIANLDVMTVKAEVSEADVIKVKEGMPVYFTVLGDPETRYHAMLQQIEPAPEEIVNLVSSSTATASSTSTAIYYNALFDIENEQGRLRALMTAEVSIVLAEAKDTLLIPATALGPRDKDGRYSVQVLQDNDTVAVKSVAVGINNKVQAEILEGLEEGDKVIVSSATAAAMTGRSGSFRPTRMFR